METIVEEDDKELKMYERESIQMKQNLKLDEIIDNENQRISNDNKNEQEAFKESKTYQEPMRFTKLNDSLLNIIEEYQEENEKELNNNNEDENNNNRKENNINNNDEMHNININEDENNENKKDDNNNIFMEQKTKKIEIKEYRIILLGDFGVGKSSLIYRYLNNKFKTNIEEESKNLENNIKIIQMDENLKIKLNIWDTAGQERNGTIFKQYYIDIFGALIVFDLTDKNSFNNIQKWINELKENSPKDTVYCFIGNKSDLIDDRMVAYEEIKDFVKDDLYYEVSSKNGNNVSLAFEQLVYKIIEKQKEEEDNPDKVIRGLEGRKTTDLKGFENDMKKKKKCC